MRIFDIGDKVRIRALYDCEGNDISCKEVFYVCGIYKSLEYGRLYKVAKQFSDSFYLLPATALISEEEFQAKKEVEDNSNKAFLFNAAEQRNVAENFQKDVNSLTTSSAEDSKYFLALDKNNSLVLIEDKPLSLRGFSNKENAIKAKNQLQTMYAEFLSSLNKR